MPPDSTDKPNPVTALMVLISKELKNAEKHKDPAALLHWFNLGRVVLEQFGDDYITPEILELREKFAALKDSYDEEEAFDMEPGPTSEPVPEPIEPSQLPPEVFAEKFTPEAAASILNSSIQFCDVIVSGKGLAAGLKFEEENMFAPMMIFLEKGASSEALIWAAGNLGVPVINNNILAKKLLSQGKAGAAIPEAAYREVSQVLMKLGSRRPRRRFRGYESNRKGVPVIIPRPLALELGETVFALTGEDPGRGLLLAEPLAHVRKRLIRLLGFYIPKIRISCNLKLKKDEYRILFKGLEAGRGKIELSWYASRTVYAGSDDIPQSAFPDIMNSAKNIRTAAKAAAEVLCLHFSNVVQRRAPELLGRDEVEAILDAAEEKYPVVTGEVKSLLTLGIIREILQSLVSEQVSIRHIAIILETLADWGSLGPAPSEFIIDQIRQSLKRQICLEYADDRLTLRVLTLEPKLDKGFADRSAGAGSDGEDLADIISSAVRGMEEKGYPPVILCSPRARAPVKEATRRKVPELAVLSYMEIPPDISVEPVGEIRLEGNVRLPG